MSTPSQLAANRRNSQSSTGPRTDAGKATSSRNSTRTGLYARSLLIDGEDPDELAALQQDYFETCDPQGALECGLVSELIRSEWLLRRMSAVESQMWDLSSPAARQDDTYDPAHHFAYVYDRLENRLVVLQRRVASLSRAYHRALQDLTRLQSLRAKIKAVQAAAPASTPPARMPGNRPAEIGFVPSNSTLSALALSPQPPIPPPAPATIWNPESVGPKAFQGWKSSVENVHTCGPLRSLLCSCKIR
jgi:hypothetical protein